jgi:hypothetical protein
MSRHNIPEKKKEDWLNSKWRPSMGWMYMCICLFDFMVAPILWTVIQAVFKGGITTQWQPLTLQGAGLFHVAMGAVIGISAHGRTQEKLGGANNGGLQGMTTPDGHPMGTTYMPPGMNPQQAGQMGGGYQPPMGSGGFGGGPAGGGFGGANGFGVNNSNTTTPGTVFSGGSAAFGAPAAGGFGSPPSGSYTPAPSWGTTTLEATPSSFNGTTQIATTASGKKIVPDSSQPLI